jgi:hypothetical protein
MSEFAALERLVSDAIDGHFGESTRLEPKAKTRYLAGAADADRDPMTLTGIVDFDPVALVAQDLGKYDGMRPSVQSERIHVSYDAASFTTWLPRANDVIVLLERPDTPRVRVSRAEPDHLGRIVCMCTHDGVEE